MPKRKTRLSKTQRYALVAMCWFCSVVVIGYLVGSYRNKDGDNLSQTFTKITKEQKKNKSFFGSDKRTMQSFSFDPNEADSTQLLCLGLTEYQVRCIYGFRRKGYRYHVPDDFRSVPDMTVEQWEHLRPLIVIDPRYRVVDVPRRKFPPRTMRADSAVTVPSQRVAQSSSAQDSLGFSRTVKLSGDELVDINTADSVTLCRIPGIGKYFASRIIAYRRQLGGFTDINQLKEIINFPVDAIAWMSVSESPEIRKLDVNHMTLRQLAKYPYIRYYRAEEIDKYRKIHGPLRSIDDLRGLPHFSEDDILRLAPYLEFK